MDRNGNPRYLIIHGHFYQPPRENPWTERIDRQEKAAPFHNWNEKITRECYLPNTLSRRLDGAGRITKLVNNYEWISFNFGPTLLHWLEEKHPFIYEKILEADRASAARCGGHGNAIAQAYNHIILPLATMRDQETQIRWGVHDFERRFEREPEGIWLPETAIDDTTLDILMSFGFRFIVLSPHQAERIRPLDAGSDWRSVADGSISAGLPYRCFGPRRKGRRSLKRYIDIFFYDAPLSQDVSFNHLLRNGDKFAEAIGSAYARGGDNLVVIATDGEIYGHHEPFADMALSYLIDSAAGTRGLEMTNFCAYLDKHEPKWEVQLKSGPKGEGTAWSCAHGVGRWKRDCGCNVGAPPGWNQKWRVTLGNGLDSLRDALAGLFESEAGKLMKDPWAARNDYIGLIEDRTPQETERFISEHGIRPLSPAERSHALSLLESQRHALLMFTSCGWFFNDISGIESIQLLMYAARAIELAGERHREMLELKLLGKLENARSNIPKSGTGADIYRNAIERSSIDTAFIVGQFAVTSHFFGDEEASEIFKYKLRPLDDLTIEIGENSLEAGSVEVSSPFTLEISIYKYLLFVERHVGFFCLLKLLDSEADYRRMKEKLSGLDGQSGREDILRAVEGHFDGRRFVIGDLFPEDRERVLKRLAAKRLEALEAGFHKLYTDNKDLLHLLNEASVIPPQGLLIPAQTVLTKKLVDDVERWERSLDPAGLEEIRKVVSEASFYGIPIDKTPAAESFTELIIENVRTLDEKLDAERCDSLLQFVRISDGLDIKLHENEIQNEIYPILRSKIAHAVESIGKGRNREEKMLGAVLSFLRLSERFNFKTDPFHEQLGGR